MRKYQITFIEIVFEPLQFLKCPRRVFKIVFKPLHPLVRVVLHFRNWSVSRNCTRAKKAHFLRCNLHILCLYANAISFAYFCQRSGVAIPPFGHFATSCDRGRSPSKRALRQLLRPPPLGLLNGWNPTTTRQPPCSLGSTWHRAPSSLCKLILKPNLTIPNQTETNLT